MAELANAPDLGFGGLSLAGSTPVTRTIKLNTVDTNIGGKMRWFICR